MKTKILGVLVLAFSLFLFFKVQNTSAQGITIPLPENMQCGDAEATDGVSDRCCYISQEDKLEKEFESRMILPPEFGCVGISPLKICLSHAINFIPSLIAKAPFVQDVYKLNASVEVKPCFVGQIENPGMDPSDPTCRCVAATAPNTRQLCGEYFDQNDKDEVEEYDACLDCADNEDGIWTALGCMHIDYTEFIEKDIFGTMVGIAGVIALLCIIYSAIIMQTSRGNAERLQKAREYLTSCLIGLLLIIFSIFILRLIGVDVLGLPGLS